MATRLCLYNVEWFNRLFQSKTNDMKSDAASTARLEAIRNVLAAIQPDLIGVVEAPNTTKNGQESTVKRLQGFADWAGLSARKAIMGYVSAGQQELALLYDEAKLGVARAAGGGSTPTTRPKFDKEFHFDSDQDRIKEIYKFYRPPLEVEVTLEPSGPAFRLMLVHPKSKGIFNNMDMAHWERESERNRRKLYAECEWIRRRADSWLAAGHQVVVMGDINDGPGMDHYEMRFSRSAVEVVMGDLFEPDAILRTHVQKPKWTAHGWNPASARYKDRFTHDPINVLIDHILLSSGLAVVAGSARVWNPYQDDSLAALKSDLRTASDHFPVTVDLAA